jgi:hypothetical protein
MVWTRSIWLRIGTSGNEPSGSVKCWEVLVHNWRLLKMGSAPWMNVTYDFFIQCTFSKQIAIKYENKFHKQGVRKEAPLWWCWRCGPLGETARALVSVTQARDEKAEGVGAGASFWRVDEQRKKHLAFYVRSPKYTCSRASAVSRCYTAAVALPATCSTCWQHQQAQNGRWLESPSNLSTWLKVPRDFLQSFLENQGMLPLVRFMQRKSSLLWLHTLIPSFPRSSPVCTVESVSVFFHRPFYQDGLYNSVCV